MIESTVLDVRSAVILAVVVAGAFFVYAVGGLLLTEKILPRFFPPSWPDFRPEEFKKWSRERERRLRSI